MVFRPPIDSPQGKNAGLAEDQQESASKMDSQRIEPLGILRSLCVEEPMARAWEVKVLRLLDVAAIEVHHLAVFQDGDHDAPAH